MRRNTFPVLALIFYLVTIAYPVVRVWSWYEPANATTGVVGLVVMLVFLIGPFALFIARFMLRMHITERWLSALQSAIGCCFLLFPVVLCLEVVRWIPWFPRGYESPIAVACVMAIALYAAVNAQRLHIKTVRVNANPSIADYTIVQLSDVHIGSRSTKYLERIVNKVLELDPTWVVITGDLIDSSVVGIKELEPLRAIAERTLFVTGNHERYEGIERVTPVLKSLGITVLRNTALDAKPFQFVGIDDHDSPQYLIAQLQTIPAEEGAYRVLLYHRPHGMREAAAWGFDLMLVGHTHHGQIFPFQLIVKRFFELTRGTHQIKQMTLHISCGTGTWGPLLRLGSHNEITQVIFA